MNEEFKISYVIDEDIVQALRAHGFTCELNMKGVINPLAPYWYRTNCPIEWNGTYTLPDGKRIVARGTSLVWEHTKEETYAGYGSTFKRGIAPEDIERLDR